MDYLILIHTDETAPAPAPGTPEFEARMAPWFAFNQHAHRRWPLDRLRQPPADATATTIHKLDGRTRRR